MYLFCVKTSVRLVLQYGCISCPWVYHAAMCSWNDNALAYMVIVLIVSLVISYRMIWLFSPNFLKFYSLTCNNLIICRYKPSPTGTVSDDPTPEYMNLLGMIFSMCGLMLKVCNLSIHSAESVIFNLEVVFMVFFYYEVLVMCNVCLLVPLLALVLLFAYVNQKINK